MRAAYGLRALAFAEARWSRSGPDEAQSRRCARSQQPAGRLLYGALRPAPVASRDLTLQLAEPPKALVALQSGYRAVRCGLPRMRAESSLVQKFGERGRAPPVAADHQRGRGQRSCSWTHRRRPSGPNRRERAAVSWSEEREARPELHRVRPGESTDTTRSSRGQPYSSLFLCVGRCAGTSWRQPALVESTQEISPPQQQRERSRMLRRIAQTGLLLRAGGRQRGAWTVADLLGQRL